MFTDPATLLPLLALAGALGWTALQPGMAPAAAVLAAAALWVGAVALREGRQQRRAAAEAQALSRRCAEQQVAIARAEQARAAATAEAREAEQRYTLALRGSQDGVWEWDTASGAVLLSPRWKGMLGFEPHELPDERAAWWQRVHPDDRPGFDAVLDACATGTAARFEHELRLVHHDGSVRWVLSRGVALQRAGAAAQRLVGMDVDVTRVRRVQSVLEAVVKGTTGASGERFFAALVEHFARALEVSCAFITECVDHPATRLRTLAFWSGGAVRDNVEYELAGTPCREVVDGARTCFHRQGVAQLFPREAGFEAYLGLPITGSDGQVLGHLAFLDTRPRGDEMLLDSVYRIFQARAASEIERLRALSLLRKMPMPAAAGSAP